MKTLILTMSAILVAQINSFSGGKTDPEILIPENETEIFTEDPVAYISENFHIKDYEAFTEAEKGSQFIVTFKCAKGQLTATYDNLGNLKSTRQRFKNITIPNEIMAEIYREHQGWEVREVKYRASGKGTSTQWARYIITLGKGGEERTFKKTLRFEEA